MKCCFFPMLGPVNCQGGKNFYSIMQVNYLGVKSILYVMWLQLMPNTILLLKLEFLVGRILDWNIGV